MMTTSGGLMETPLQTGFPTPSRIPVLARKCLLSDGGSPASGQENRDPKGMMHKMVGAQLHQRDLVLPRHRLKKQTVDLKGNLRPRVPLEEISPGSVGQNVKADPPPRPVDPGDLATLLSSMEVTSNNHDCQTGLAQRVMIQGKQNPKVASCRVQVQTPRHHTRSSFFSSNQESTQRNVIHQTQMNSDSGQLRARTRLPAHQTPGEPAAPSYSEVLNSSQSRQEIHSLAQQDSPRFPWTSSPSIQFTPGQVGHASPFGLANRVPVTCPSALTSYSVAHHLAVFSRTPQATPAPIPSVQQEQIVVKKLYEENWASLEEEPEKPPPITPLNSMSLELSRQEVGPRDVGVAPSSNRMSLELSRYQRINILKQLLQQEVEGLAKEEDSHQSGSEPQLAMIPCTMQPSDHGSVLPHSGGPKQHPDVGEPLSTGGSVIQALIQQLNLGMYTTASTKLTFFQCSLCGSIPFHSLDSLRNPNGTIDPAVTALCQQLNAWMEAIRLLCEGCLDDECAFYTGQSIPGPQRICKNPVATWLERQETMGFVPISSPAH